MTNASLALILPANGGHPVQRVHYATEVNHDKTKSSKEDGLEPGVKNYKGPFLPV
jgi:hypothetical protein